MPLTCQWKCTPVLWKEAQPSLPYHSDTELGGSILSISYLPATSFLNMDATWMFAKLTSTCCLSVGPAHQTAIEMNIYEASPFLGQLSFQMQKKEWENSSLILDC